MHGQTPSIVKTAVSRPGWLRKHADYQRVYKSARKQFSPSMTWFASPREKSQTLNAGLSSTHDEMPRVGLTAGKVLGKAHERNRIKRRMREIVRRHLHLLPGNLDLILHPRRSVLTMDFAKLDAEILRIFRQASVPARAQTESNRPSFVSHAGASSRPKDS